MRGPTIKSGNGQGAAQDAPYGTFGRAVPPPGETGWAPAADWLGDTGAGWPAATQFAWPTPGTGPDVTPSTSILANPGPGQDETPVTNSSVGSGGATAAQVQQALDEAGINVNGSGIKVGVLSDSFNDLGGAAADEADGALPPASSIQVLKDLVAGGSDEGRAMMEIIHDIAPGASLAFYTAFNSEQDFANGILALAAAGCKVICDDVSYYDEPFFQNGVVAQAIQTVEAEGVTYVTAAGNEGSDAYQASWTPTSGTYDGVHLTDAESFGGSLVQTITLSTSGSYTVPLLLEWDQAYGAATSDLELLVFHNGVLYGTATNVTTGEPNNPFIYFNFTQSGTYQIAIENLSGADPGLIKEITAGDGLPVTISGANAGTVYGHAMTPGAITAGAVSAAYTPAFGDNTPINESFSSSGAGTELLFSNSGSRLSSPDQLSPVALSGIDDIATTVSGGLSDFYGTSAASASLAGVAALILAADPSLTPAQVEQIMEATALPMSNTAVAGAGLAQVAPAVAMAEALLNGTTPPTVSSVVTAGTGITNGTGDLGTGKTVTLTLNFSKAVIVAGGTPTLTLNDGGSATYVSGSNSTALVFSYTVGSGQNTADLAVTAYVAHGATIMDSNGNAADLTGAVANPAGILQIDSTPPAVSSVVTSGAGITNGSGHLNTGSVVTLTVNMSEAVTVTGGTPTLTLNDNASATYKSGSGSATLVFQYTVAAGQNTGDLAVTGAVLHGATIADSAGNATSLADAAVNPAGILQIGENPEAVGDFNGDAKSDILWRNNTTGAVTENEMNGSQIIATATAGGDLTWSVVGVGDFNGDGKSDILWENNTTGQVAEYQMNGTQITSTAWIGGALGWSIVGVGDFNGDGKSDILWENPTGQVAEYQMNGAQVLSTAWVGGALGWSIVGVGDFNGDGKSDILWENNVTGQVAEYQMNGAQVVSTAWVGGALGWSVVGVGDFNGDGKSDILWENDTTGQVAEYLMNGSQVLSTAWVGGNLNNSVVGVGDFNGDGKSDILWQNHTTGQVTMNLMNGSQVLSSTVLGGNQTTSIV